MKSRSRRDLFLPLAVFLWTRLITTALLVRASPEAIALVEPGRPAVKVAGASYAQTIMNWDGRWYELIARQGYPSQLPAHAGHVDQNAWAFYPLFPSLSHVLMTTGVSFPVAASVVNLLAGAVASVLIYRLLAPRSGSVAALMVLLVLNVFPSAAAFQSTYTESLALLLVAASLLCMVKRRYAILLVVVTCLALTRPIVLPLSVVVAIHFWLRHRRRFEDPWVGRQRILLLAAVLWTPISFGLWPAVAAIATGRVDAYLATQRAWSAAITSSGATWISRVTTGGNHALAVLLILFIMAMAILLFRPAARRWPLELRVWAAAYLLYILCTGLVTPSVIRYLMLCVVPWWPFPEIGRPGVPRWFVGLCVATVSIAGATLQWLWLTHYFVVTTPHVRIP